MRKCLQAFVRAGLVELLDDPGESRRTLVKGSSLLQQTIEAYQERMLEVAKLIPGTAQRRSDGYSNRELGSTVHGCRDKRGLRAKKRVDGMRIVDR